MSQSEQSESFLALVTDAYRGYGGIARYNVDFFEALAELAWVDEIEVLPRLVEDGSVHHHGKVTQKKEIHDKRMYALRALWRTMVRRPANIFCGHLYHIPLAMWLARISGARLISQVHGSEVWGAVKPSLLVALAKSDLILCVSEYTKAELLKAMVYPADQIVVVPNRVGDAFVAHDHMESRSRIGLGSVPMVLSVGRLDERGGYKGHDRVIRLMAELKTRDLEFEYLIAGTGGDRPRLEALVEQSGLTSHVRFLGRVPPADLPYLYAAADLFVLPSTGEGFGIVFVEATACGTPVLGLDVGGSREAIVTTEFGGAVDPDHFNEAFKLQLQKAKSMSPEDRRRLSNKTISQFGGDSFRSRISFVLGPRKGEASDYQ